MHAPLNVAKWMLEMLKKDQDLYQKEAVSDIQQNLGDAFVYRTRMGTWPSQKSPFRVKKDDRV